MNQKTREIRNTITKLENPFPKDDLITSYKDFLKFRAELPFYQFNLNVLIALIKLSNDTWNTKERISRISIIQLIKRYGFKEDVNVSYYRFLKVNKPSKELRISLFKLFKRCFEKNTPLTNKQSLEAKRICNSMLFQLPLNNEAIQWLCDNAFESEMVLNRVLKYPVKSEIITNWVKLNYDKDTLRNRRADLVGWMIDYDSNFEVSNQTLIDDFEYLNSLDIKAIENYQDELKATEMMEAEFKETMENRDHTSISKSYTNTWLFPEFKVTPPELKQTKRYHKVFYNHKIQDETHKTAYDFQKMRTYYYDNLSTFKENLMLWSTNYSRIDRREKSKLLKRYYSPENYYSFIKIAERNKLVGPLKWLLKNYKLIPKEITEKKESKNENVF